MWIADKLAYRGEENFARAYEGSTLVWEKIPSNKIYYTSTDGKKVVPHQTDYGSDKTYQWNTRITSNTYSGGIGVITFAGEVLWVPDCAFEDCTKLSSMILPGGITDMGPNAFGGCTNLTSINIPSGVTSIAGNLFNSCDNLSSIVIPNSVISIGEFAFWGCEKLSSLVIPSGVLSIGKAVFSHCYDLASINIPSGVTEINIIVFGSCTSLTSIVIPSSITKIEYDAFIDCTSLSEVIVNAVNPPAMTLSPYSHTYTQFLHTPSNLQIKVPAGSVQAYKTATGWSDYASQIVSQ